MRYVRLRLRSKKELTLATKGQNKTTRTSESIHRAGIRCPSHQMADCPGRTARALPLHGADRGLAIAHVDGVRNSAAVWHGLRQRVLGSIAARSGLRGVFGRFAGGGAGGKRCCGNDAAGMGKDVSFVESLCTETIPKACPVENYRAMFMMSISIPLALVKVSANPRSLLVLSPLQPDQPH